MPISLREGTTKLDVELTRLRAQGRMCRVALGQIVDELTDSAGCFVSLAIHLHGPDFLTTNALFEPNEIYRIGCLDTVTEEGFEELCAGMPVIAKVLRQVSREQYLQSVGKPTKPLYQYFYEIHLD